MVHEVKCKTCKCTLMIGCSCFEIHPIIGELKCPLCGDIMECACDGKKDCECGEDKLTEANE